MAQASQMASFSETHKWVASRIVVRSEGWKGQALMMDSVESD